MAKTKYAIDMDFKKATKQAEELNEIATELDNLAKNDMANCLSSIGKNWKGDNASAYINKGNTVKGNIENVAKELREVAGTIKTIAEKTQKAELAALDIVKN